MKTSTLALLIGLMAVLLGSLSPAVVSAQGVTVVGLEIIGPDGTLISAECEADPSTASCPKTIIQEGSSEAQTLRLIQKQTQREIKKSGAQRKRVRRDLFNIKKAIERQKRVNERFEKNFSKERLEKLRKRRKKYRERERRITEQIRTFNGTFRSLKSCKRKARNVCTLGAPPEKCQPESCFGSGSGDLDNTGNGDASFGSPVVRVGEILTATAFAYDSDRYGVSWPQSIGEQITPCTSQSTSCSWRVTAPTNGWAVAVFGIGGFFGTGFEGVPYAVLP